MKKITFFMLFVFLLVPLWAWAACSGSSPTLTTASCSKADIDDCVSAASDGDTILVKDGDCTHTESVTVDLSAGKALTIRWEHDCTLDASGRPNLSTSCATKISGTNVGFSFTGAYGKSIRLAHMTLSGGVGVKLSGASQSWRVDHIYFDSPTGSTVAEGRIVSAIGSGSNTARSFGVIDHVKVYSSTALFLQTKGNTNTGGNYDWSLGPELGTANAVYVEDSEFITPTTDYYGAFLNDCTDGGSDVFRYNVMGSSIIQSHDAIVSGQRGCKKVEAYYNAITNESTPNRPNANFIVRGGAQVIYGNTVTNTPDNAAIQVSIYRANAADESAPPWDTMCGSSSGTAILDSVTAAPANCSSGTGCVNKDGAGTGGFPCRDQLGTAGNGTQTIIPALYWNNRVDGSYISPSLGYGSSYMTKGDASTDGVYCANSSATKPSLSDCKNYMVYSAYAYPHPLRGEYGTMAVGAGGSITFGSGGTITLQ